MELEKLLDILNDTVVSGKKIDFVRVSQSTVDVGIVEPIQNALKNLKSTKTKFNLDRVDNNKFMMSVRAGAQYEPNFRNLMKLTVDDAHKADVYTDLFKRVFRTK